VCRISSAASGAPRATRHNEEIDYEPGEMKARIFSAVPIVGGRKRVAETGRRATRSEPAASCHERWVRGIAAGVSPVWCLSGPRPTAGRPS